MQEYYPAVLLFFSQSAMVTLLVIQSRLNIHGRNTWAAVNSLLIGCSQLVMWRIMPDPTNAEIVAFVVGGPVGNAVAQYFNRRDIAKIRKLHVEEPK